MNKSLTADIDELTGEAGDDVFNAGLTVAGTATLQAFDVLNGGEGADTLNATLTDDVGAVTLNSIETLNLRATGDFRVDLENATGVERVVNNRSIGDLIVENVQNLVDIAVNGVGTENAPLDFTVDYDAAALGAADTAQSIELNNAQLGNLNITDANNLTSLNIAVTGENAVDALNVSGTIDTLTVTGAGSLAVDSDIDAGTINAAGVAGDLELSLGTTGAADLATGVTARTVVLGSGDDTLDVSAVTLGNAAEGSFAGGAGRDTIVVDGTTANLVDLLAEKVSGFEVLNLDGLDDAVSDSVLRALGYQALIVTDAANGAEVTGLTAASNLTLVNTNGTADDITLTVSGAATNDNAAFTLTVEGREADINNANGDSEFDIAIAGVENLTVNTVKNSAAAAHTVTTLTLADAALENLTVAGSEAVLVDVDTGFANLERVDASGITAASDAATGEFAAEISVGNNVTVIGSAGDDSIAFGEQSTITGGAGADTFVVGLVAESTATTPAPLFSTITDFSVAQEDSISFGSSVLSAATGGTAVNLIEVADLGLQPGAEATFQDFLDAAFAADGSGGALVSAFVFQGNTYVVEDNTAAATFAAATDYIVQLAGVVDLADYTFA